jgi:probable mobile endonuclease D
MDILNISEITEEIYLYLKSNIEKAKTTYTDLIEQSRSRGLDKSSLSGYYEIHHIEPRCLGGNNESSNLVLLTYKEHIIAHLLLHVINLDNKELFLSFSLMIQLKPQEGFRVNLDMLESLKNSRSKFMKGNYNPMKNPEVSRKVSQKKKGMVSTFKGKHHSLDTRKKISDKIKSLNFSGERHPMFGKKHSPESIKRCLIHIKV